jgi:cytoskeletal protein CcmA (bactofilin family)
MFGSIQGNVEATDKIDIKKEAKLVGDIKTSRIMIEDGAYFKGSIDIAKAAAQPQRPANAPATPTGPVVPAPPPPTVSTISTGSK